MSLSKNINPSLVQPRKTCPFITERLLMGPLGPKESKTNKQNMIMDCTCPNSSLFSVFLQHDRRYPRGVQVNGRTCKHIKETYNKVWKTRINRQITHLYSTCVFLCNCTVYIKKKTMASLEWFLSCDSVKFIKLSGDIVYFTKLGSAVAQCRLLDERLRV